MIPIFVAIFYLTIIPYNFVISAVVFALAAFTDFLDGYIARKYNLVTDMGKFLDPIADKVLVSTALIIFLAVPMSSGFAFPYEFLVAISVAIILARELIVSGFRLVAAGKNMVIAADLTGKIKTFFTDITIVVMLVSIEFNVLILTYVALVMLLISTILTVISGVECIVKNKQVLKETK
jgi:CDP-diacylglycerol--glycerol-3-phosphate 3-phosphatidyltransferase